MKWNSFDLPTLIKHEQTLMDLCQVEVVKKRVDISCGNYLMTYACGPSSGPVIVMLHGYLGGSLLFYRLIPALAKHYRVICVDLLGMGQSSRPNQGPFEDQETAESYFVYSLEEAVAAEGFDEFILVGHSFGGYIAGCYALKFRRRVRQLLLLSPAGVSSRGVDHNVALEFSQFSAGKRLRGKIIGWIWKTGVTIASFLRAAGPFSDRIVKLYTRRRFSMLPDDEMTAVENYLCQINLLPGSGEYAIFRILDPGVFARMPLCNRLVQLKIPISFFYGSYDWMNSRGADDLERESNSPVEVKVTDRSGHHLYIENAPMLAQQMMDSLELFDVFAVSGR